MFGEHKTTLKLTGRAGMIYSDAGRVMKINSEMLASGDYDMVVYVRSMQAWQPPHENEPVSDLDREKIKKDIERHLKRSRIDWQA